MFQGSIGGFRFLSIGMRLTVLVLLMGVPLASAEEARLAGASASANDAGHWLYTLMAPLAVREEAAFTIDGMEDGRGGRWSFAQETPSGPSEGAPIPFEVGKRAKPEPWPYDLPFLADKVIEQGYTLPLPRGVSFVYTYIKRDVKINRVRVGVNGAPLREVTDFVDLGSTSHVNVAVGRFDAWLLPFLNVYALAGFVSNDTTTRGIVTIPPLTPRGEPRTFNLVKTTDLSGFVGGVGLTAAAGWREFFILADFNFSQTDIGFDDPFRALIGTVRAGWNGALLGAPIRLWVGGTYWGTSGTAKATVNVPDVGSVTFAADQGPLHPLNALVGANVTLFKRWELFAEYGFNFDDVDVVAAGLSFRF